MPNSDGPLPEADQVAADRALVADVLARTPLADEALALEVSRIGRPIVRRIVDRNDGEAALNELLVHVWERNWRVLRQWGQDIPLVRYLSTVARNFAIDYARRTRKDIEHRASPSDIDAAVDPHWMADPERVQQARDARQCLEHATEQLSDVHKSVVRLRYHEGLEHWEIASRLEKTIGYVGPTLARAEVALRNALRDRCRELIESLIGARGPVHG